MDDLEWAIELLAEGADMNVKDEDGKTGLELAKGEENESLIELLYAVQGKGTALMNAIVNDSAKAVDMLLQKNAPVDQKDARGNTALHVACSRASPPASSRIFLRLITSSGLYLGLGFHDHAFLNENVLIFIVACLSPKSKDLKDLTVLRGRASSPRC